MSVTVWQRLILTPLSAEVARQVAENVSTAHDTASRLKGGRFYVDGYELGDNVSLGSFRQPGWGREMGRAGLERYLETRFAWVTLKRQHGFHSS